MIKDHVPYTVDNMGAGVAFTIQLDGIPLPCWSFSVRIFETTPACLALRAKRRHGSVFIIKITPRRIRGDGNIENTAGHTPIIAAIALLDLEFLRPHPVSVIGTVRTNGKVEQAAVAFAVPE